MTSVMHIFQVFNSIIVYVNIFPVIMFLCDYLSVCLSVSVFSLGKKLTRQEDQKLFSTMFGLTINVK